MGSSPLFFHAFHGTAPVPTAPLCAIVTLTFNPEHSRNFAVTADADTWLLINASPDLHAQLNDNSEVRSDPARGLRNTSVAGVILMSADLDHVLGLFLMREFTPVRIYATRPVLSILRKNSFFQMLDRLPGQSRRTAIELGVTFRPGKDLTCTPIAMSNSLPAYLGEEERASWIG
jgi:pyrroloquinoline quinone biosynthesis protein B